MKLVASPERLREVIRYYLEHGEKKTRKDFGISAETLGRYRRDYNQIEDDFEEKAVLLQIREQFSEAELRAIAKGGTINPGSHRPAVLDFEGEEHTFLVISDTHIGHEDFDERYLLMAFEEGEKRGAEFATLSGDVTEGMSNRPGHTYELHQLGYARQRKYAGDLLRQWKKPLEMIDGNHDRWFIKSAGAIIVEDLAQDIPNAEFLGHDVGTLYLNGVEIMLWHGEDGNSYATSYRLQKIVEAMNEGQVPGILIAGHTHKKIHMESRDCEIISAGSIEKQTAWMRSKRIGADVGFWVVKVAIASGIVKWIEPRWYRIREKKVEVA